MAAPLTRKINRIQKILQTCSINATTRLNTYNRFISIQRLRETSSPQNQRPLQRIQNCRFYSTQSEPADAEEELDVLYRQIVVETKAHDPAVLRSYRTFICQAAIQLNIKPQKVEAPKKHIDRRSLLRSSFIYKKHWTQYEMRTYFNVFTFKHLTGSTADTFLEYIQRNLPEGVAMKVSRYRLEKFPEHLKTLKEEQKIESES